MTTNLLASVLLSCCFALAYSSEGVSGAAVLTQADFEERVGDGQEIPWFVKFYAPWCGHCKTLEPVWDDLAGRLSGVAQVAKVDATKAKQLTDEWDVEGYPTLKLIAQGKVYTYSGKRTADDLEAWARGGWRESAAENLPKDRPVTQRAVKVFFSYFWTYGLPLAAIISVGLVVWTIRSGQPSDQEIAQRQQFEHKLEEYERRIAEKRARVDSGKGRGLDGRSSRAASNADEDVQDFDTQKSDGGEMDQAVQKDDEAKKDD